MLVKGETLYTPGSKRGQGYVQQGFSAF